MAPQKLTEYERKRLENIKRNDQMIASLKIHSKASQLSAAAAASKRQSGRDGSSKSYKVKLSPEKKPKTQDQNPIVIRRSLRTRGMPPDSTGLDFDFVDPPNKPTKVFDTPQKPSARVLGPITIRDAYRGTTGTDQALISTILTIGKKPQLGGGEDVKGKMCNGVSGDPTVKSQYLDCGMKSEVFEGCLDVGSMSLEEQNIARVMPGRIIVVKFLPSNDVRMIAAGNKFGDVAFWNVDSKGDEEDGIFLYHPHSAPVSGILFQHSCFSKVYTSCYNGYLRLMDAEKEIFDLLYSTDEAIFSLSQRQDDVNSLYFGEGHGGLNVWDERTGGFSSQWILHEARINTIDFNSQNPNIMATCSTDGTACLWDLRSINADKPKSLKMLSHKRAVHSAYFSPSGSSLATTSIDDTVGILNGVDFQDTSMIYHYNQTGRWISSFRAIWGWDDSSIFIGYMKRGVDVISPTLKKTIMTLQSPYISAIPCRFDAHPSKVGMLAGATSGGQVYIWTSN